jgi:hypothetical protein
MSLSQLLLELPTREESGSATASRYDFQKNWGLAELLKRHEAETDYCVVFEFHEDVIILDSPTNPTRVAFFQVKTKQGKHWLVSALLHRKGNEQNGYTLSPLAKLIGNLVKFPNNTESLNFVSNAVYNFDLDDESECTGKLRVCAKELAETDREKIKEQITSELKPATVPQYEELTHFHVCDLSLTDHEVHVKGKLTTFLERLAPGKRVQITTVYRVLFDEVRRKNNAQADKSDLEKFIATKGISRADFERILTSVGLYRDYDKAWTSIEQQLVAESVPFLTVQRLRIRWFEYEVQRMDATNIALQTIRKKIRAVVENVKPTAETKISSVMTHGIAELVNSDVRPSIA